jgi:lysophospholipase L1-like esterase
VTSLGAACLDQVPHNARAAVLHGLGVMGDSGSDGSSVNKWPGMLQADRGLNFGGSGLPYNHAVGGATSTTLLNPQHQDTALASNVTAGNVTTGIIFIGNNDYGNAATSILSGSLSGAALTNFENTVANNIETASQTVLNAGAEGFLLGSVNNFAFEPAAAAATPAQKLQLENSITNVNNQLIAFADAKHVPYVDFFGLEKSVLATNATSIIIGGVPISLTATGSSQLDFFQDALHPNIVGNAIIANMWMAALNKAYDTNLPLFTDQQILSLAGLSGYTGETFSTSTNLSNFIHFVPAPEPSTALLAVIGFALLAGRALRTLGRSSVASR